MGRDTKNTTLHLPDMGNGLKELRDEKGWTHEQASQRFGMSKSGYIKLERGERKLSDTWISKAMSVFGVTAAEVLGGGADLAHVNDVASVPLAGTVSAGIFVEQDGAESEGVMIPAIPRRDVPSHKQYALRISGPSVNKKIADGAYAICAPLDSFPGGAAHGSLVHVVRERAGLYEHTIKEVHYLKDRVVLMPCSTDPRFQDPIEINGDENALVRIAGVVIGAYQPL